MEFANWFAAGIFLAVAGIFWGIAAWARRQEKPVHFWAGSTVKPEEIHDIPAYNKANAKMWTVAAALYTLGAIMSLIDTTLGGIFIGVISTVGIIPLIIAYKRIYEKYKI